MRWNSKTFKPMPFFCRTSFFLAHATHAKILWTHATHAKISTHATYDTHFKILWTHATHAPTYPCTHATHEPTQPNQFSGIFNLVWKWHSTSFLLIWFRHRCFVLTGTKNLHALNKSKSLLQKNLKIVFNIGRRKRKRKKRISPDGR